MVPTIDDTVMLLVSVTLISSSPLPVTHIFMPFDRVMGAGTSSLISLKSVMGGGVLRSTAMMRSFVR